MDENNKTILYRTAEKAEDHPIITSIIVILCTSLFLGLPYMIPSDDEFNVTGTDINVEEKEEFIVMSAEVTTKVEYSDFETTYFEGRDIRIVDENGAYVTGWQSTEDDDPISDVGSDNLREGDSFVQSYTWEISSAEANFWGEVTNRDVSEISNAYTVLFKEEGEIYYFNDEDEKVEWTNSESFNN